MSSRSCSERLWGAFLRLAMAVDPPPDIVDGGLPPGCPPLGAVAAAVELAGDGPERPAGGPQLEHQGDGGDLGLVGLQPGGQAPLAAPGSGAAEASAVGHLSGPL